VHGGDVSTALALVDESHASPHEQRRSLREAARALEAIAGQDPEALAHRLPRSDLRIGEVAAHIGVRTSALRVWEEAGLLAPRRDPATGYRRYTARGGCGTHGWSTRCGRAAIRCPASSRFWTACAAPAARTRCERRSRSGRRSWT
jgi:hypothetical protein